jgi:hypothetical protein
MKAPITQDTGHHGIPVRHKHVSLLFRECRDDKLKVMQRLVDVTSFSEQLPSCMSLRNNGSLCHQVACATRTAEHQTLWTLSDPAKSPRWSLDRRTVSLPTARDSIDTVNIQ